MRLKCGFCGCALKHHLTCGFYTCGDRGRGEEIGCEDDFPGADRLYFRQLLSGTDFAASDAIAQQMRNFAYLIGDRETGDCVVVDPAYAANDLLDALESDGMHLSGCSSPTTTPITSAGR